MRFLVLVLALAAGVAACGGNETPEAATVGGPGKLVVETANGSVELDVEIADTEEERQRGLMGRTELGEREGMLFLFPEDTQTSFWMKDTLIPLSIAFAAADGEILRILDMEPCTADPCPLYDPGVPYRAALEMGKGAFERLGIAVGDVVQLPG